LKRGTSAFAVRKGRLEARFGAACGTRAPASGFFRDANRNVRRARHTGAGAAACFRRRGVVEKIMELLDLLESRVASLITEVELLRKENAKLREDASVGLAALTEENGYLKHALEEEQKLKDAVLQRIDSLLKRIQSVADDAS
jgi:hypothetical protein